MPVFNRENVIGYYVGQEVYHPECFKSIKQTLTVDGVVRGEDLAENIFFCSECGKEIECHD